MAYGGPGIQNVYYKIGSAILIKQKIIHSALNEVHEVIENKVRSDNFDFGASLVAFFANPWNFDGLNFTSGDVHLAKAVHI
jgi:hypothetical protein